VVSGLQAKVQLATMLITTLVLSFLVCRMLEVRLEWCPVYRLRVGPHM